MLDDLVNQIKANLYDRARSPLFGAFLIAWVSWNFRTVLLIFSNGDATVKIEAVSKLYKTNLSYVCQGILYPLLSSAAFILIYPYLAKVAFWHWNKQHISIKKIQQKQEDETPATQDEINYLRKNSLAQQIALQNEIRNLSNANNEFALREKELMNQINELRKNISVSDGNIEVLKNEITNFSKNIISKDESISKLTSEIDNLKENQKTKSKSENTTVKSPEENNKFITLIKLFSNDEALNDDKEYLNLIDYILNYSNQHRVSIDILRIIFLISWNDGKLDPSNVKKILRADLSEIEIDDCFNKLKKMNLTFYNTASDIRLSEIGTEFAVSSKITTIIKLIKSNNNSNKS